jgi:hypothetical protein
LGDSAGGATARLHRRAGRRGGVVNFNPPRPVAVCRAAGAFPWVAAITAGERTRPTSSTGSSHTARSAGLRSFNVTLRRLDLAGEDLQKTPWRGPGETRPQCCCRPTGSSTRCTGLGGDATKGETIAFRPQVCRRNVTADSKMRRNGLLIFEIALAAALFTTGGRSARRVGDRKLQLPQCDAAAQYDQ